MYVHTYIGHYTNQTKLKHRPIEQNCLYTQIGEASTAVRIPKATTTAN